MITSEQPQWSCCGCGDSSSGTPPWHRLCQHCLDYFARQGLRPDPQWPADQTPPPCPCCGKTLIPVIFAPELAEQVGGDDR